MPCLGFGAGIPNSAVLVMGKEQCGIRPKTSARKAQGCAVTKDALIGIIGIRRPEDE